MHDHHQQETGHKQQRDNGMPLDEQEQMPKQPPGCFGGLFCHLRRLTGGFPRLLLVLPFELLFLPEPGKGAFIGLGMLPRQPSEFMLGAGPAVLAFPFPHLTGGAGTQAALRKPNAAAHKGLPGKLGLVRRLHANILLLHLIDFAVNIGMGLMADYPARRFYGAGLFGRLLFRELIAGLVQLFSRLLYAPLRPGLFLVFGSAAITGGSGPAGGRGLFALLPQPFGGAGAVTVPPVFPGGLLDFLSRSAGGRVILPRHVSSPPGVS